MLDKNFSTTRARSRQTPDRHRAFSDKGEAAVEIADTVGIDEQTAWEILRTCIAVVPYGPLFIRCTDGITRWIIPPKPAFGCEIAREIHPGVRANYSRGPRYLWPLESMIYAGELRNAVTRAIETLRLVFADEKAVCHQGEPPTRMAGTGTVSR